MAMQARRKSPCRRLAPLLEDAGCGIGFGRRSLFEVEADEVLGCATFRLEAIRAGFRRAWQTKDYATIVNIMLVRDEQFGRDNRARPAVAGRQNARQCGRGMGTLASVGRYWRKPKLAMDLLRQATKMEGDANPSQN